MKQFPGKLALLAAGLSLLTGASCTLFRAAWHFKPDTSDYRHFPNSTIENGQAPFQFHRSQLHRKATALTGNGASNFINAIRLRHAKHLLLTTDLTVAEIAYQTGMEPNYFSRFFKEETALTPTEFRGRK